MLYGDDEQETFICKNCVGEGYLASQIARSGDERKCSYCESITQSWTLEELSSQIESAFERHYMRTSDQPESWEVSLLADKESDYEWERSGTPIVDAIVEAAEISVTAAEDIQEILSDKYYDRYSAEVCEETEFSSDSYYQEIGPSDATWRTEWNRFEQSLKSEARFFSRIAVAHLAAIFGDIHQHKTQNGHNLIVDIGPGMALEELYRARIFQSEDKLKEALCRPDLHLGPPPSHFATPGRMNARGISVFYGATEPSVALAEVRPPVGSYVMVAKFRIVRCLRVLDLSALEFIYAEGSIFDPSYKNNLERVAFLTSLGKRITKPVMPDDQDLDYLATQAIADFLATENKPQLDGILFPSVQSESGDNLVLFHKAAKVAEEDFPEGTEIHVSSGHGDEYDGENAFYVSEEIPPQDTLNMNEYDNFSWGNSSYDESSDNRVISLQIDMASVEVHRIESVEVKSSSCNVTRHRWENRKV
ncbi:RES family NAD+ phosphorylase [Aeromonas veronii]|uniref:RES family NAD+ phosphorylase n=1 Tax=Aeromonas veronii TaxID=654 RepID=UPI0031FDF743